jgi:TRAP-type mannitol/chloroaromatic compound transport system permease small subunit
VFRHTVFFVTHHLFLLFFALITIHATNDYNKKTWKVWEWCTCIVYLSWEWVDQQADTVLPTLT